MLFRNGLFNGMLFKDFVLNGFTIIYNYYHMRRPDISTQAVATLKLVVYSPSQTVTTTYIFEPSHNKLVPFQNWTSVTINQNTGSSDKWPGSSGGRGWRTSGGNAFWVDPPTPPPQATVYRSLWKYVDSLVKSNKPAINDAIIVQLQLGLGADNVNATSLVDKVRVMSGGSDYTWYF